MRALLAPVLWVLAVSTALIIVYRLWRGKPGVLRGTWSPRVVRMVAVLLVTLGYSPDGAAQRTLGAPIDKTQTNPNDELPRTVTVATLNQWHQRQSPRDPWLTFKQNVTHLLLGAENARSADAPEFQRDIGLLPPVLRSHFQAELARLAKPEPTRYRAEELLAVLDAAEQHGYYDHWLNAHLWRKTAMLPEKDRPAVFARLHRHARVTDAIIRSFAEVKPTLDISPRAWMSKAGPSAAERRQMQHYQDQLKEILLQTTRLFGVLDEGTWKRDGVTRLRVTKESALMELQRGPRRQAYGPNEEFRFGRLDCLATPVGAKRVTLEHSWLGVIELPAAKTISVWDMPRLLTDAQKKQVDEAVAAALLGNEDAADRIETSLPFTHAGVRIGLQEAAQARFAPRLRMILALFDDSPMPAVAEPRNPALEDRRGLGR